MKDFIEKAAGWIALLGAFALGRAIGIVGLLVIYIPVGAGLWVANKFAKKFNPTLLQIVIWLNLIAWLLPILGLFFGTITGTLLFKDAIAKKHRFLVENLTVFGIILSLSNALLAVLNGIASNPPEITVGRYFQHLVLFAIAGYLIWFGIRIHLGRKYKSTAQKVLLGIATFVLIYAGVAMGMGVGEAWTIRGTDSAGNTDNSHSSAMNSEDVSKYWASFQQICEEQALTNEGITSADASAYCGCITDGISAEYTPEQAENGGADSNSAYSTTLAGIQPGCATTAGLELQ